MRDVLQGGNRLMTKFFQVNNTTKISIVIATFNAADTLQQCLDSVYSQTHQNNEIIVIDGASTDRTVDILKSNSERIYYWRSEKDNGIYYAMNKALDYITGDWIIFLGADDELLPGFSDMAAELVDPFSIYYGNVLYKGIKCSGYLSPYKMVKTGMSHQSMFYPKSVFKTHRYNLEYKISADSILNMNCWSDKSINFVYKDHIIANYNHTGISSKNYDSLLLKNMSDLVLRHYGIIIWLRYRFRALKKTLREA